MAEILKPDSNKNKNHILFGKSKTPEEIRNEIKVEKLQLTPLDIEGVFRYLNIDIIFESMEDDLSGILEFRNHNWVAVVNQWHHPNRIRFTLAHELAHYYLHRRLNNKFVIKSLFSRSETNLNKQEREANDWAANLLMPENEFNKFVNDGVDTLAGLAEQFQVSMLAVEVRARVLGYRV